MRVTVRELSICSAIGLCLTGLCAPLSSVEHLSWVGVIFAPGMLLAAMALPEGVHSDHATLWLVLTFMLTAILLALVAFALLRWRNARLE